MAIIYSRVRYNDGFDYQTLLTWNITIETTVNAC